MVRGRNEALIGFAVGMTVEGGGMVMAEIEIEIGFGRGVEVEFVGAVIEAAVVVGMKPE